MKKIYIWQEGDCLKKISEKFKVPIDRIAEYNGITNVDLINKGDVIFIP